MGFDPTVHHVDVKGKTCYVYEFTPKDPGETLYSRTTKTIFDPHITCISGRKMPVWRVIQVTSPDGLEQKGDKEVVLKDVQAFLGFANFYRHFIQDYSKITVPLVGR